MHVQILGPMRVTVDGQAVSVGTARKPRLMLATLLSRAGQPVSISSLTHALWGTNPPPSARRNIQLYAHRLRRALGNERICAADGGYAFISADVVDAVQFRRLAEQGRAAADSGRVDTAARHWREALELWRGPALAEYDDCVLISEEAQRLEQLRLDLYERWAKAQLRVGREDRMVAELTDLVGAHPFRESLSGVLMRALYRAGRRAEALAAFRRTREHLIEHLGIEPGPELQQLHTAILRSEDTLIFQPPLGEPMATLDRLTAEASRNGSILAATISGPAEAARWR